jgi:hypothetical protein
MERGRTIRAKKKPPEVLEALAGDSNASTFAAASSG